MKHVVVIGGGISGLAAAHGCAEQAPDSLRITVLERQAEVGGKAITLHEDGWIVEAGPTGFLDNEPALDRLIEKTGLTKLPADVAAARRFVVCNGRMREIHAHPLKFARSGILSPLGMLRVVGETLIPARRDGDDESVWEFAARRLGEQAADRLIAPMVLGIFAGDAKRLSLPAAFPRMASLEREHGSLIRGMLALKKSRKSHGGPSGPAGQLTSFAEGMSALPRALAANDRLDVRCSTTVESVVRLEDGRFKVSSNSESLLADAVILAGEPWAMGSLIEESATELARELRGIFCPPVAVVALGYGEEALARVPRGFGALICRQEGYRILGCLWDTHLFPGRSPQKRLLVRTMLGGSTDPEVGDLDSEELIHIARSDMTRLFGWNLEPVFHKVIQWPRAIPQYELGHLGRLKRIDHELQQLPGLFLCGNALRGIAFGKAAAAGLACGEEAGRWLKKGTDLFIGNK